MRNSPSLLSSPLPRRGVGRRLYGNAIYDFAINPAGVKAGADPQVFALGMRHNF